MAKVLTGPQEKVLGCIREFCQKNNFPPTLREIGLEVGLKNINAVRGHLAALERKGFIARLPDKARSLRVLPGGETLLRPPSGTAVLAPPVEIDVPEAFPGARKVAALARMEKQPESAGDFHNDRGILFQVGYSMAWQTWRQSAILVGAAREIIEQALAREAQEQGWTLGRVLIAPDGVALAIEAHPRHGPEAVLRRLQTAVHTASREHPREFPLSQLWERGYLITTFAADLNELMRKLNQF